MGDYADRYGNGRNLTPEQLEHERDPEAEAAAAEAAYDAQREEDSVSIYPDNWPDCPVCGAPAQAEEAEQSRTQRLVNLAAFLVTLLLAAGLVAFMAAKF